MVDVTDFTRANQLLNEKALVMQAITRFDEGGRIIALTVGVPSDDELPIPPPPITVLTDYIDYPAQMEEAIIAALHQREEAIASELANLGVTGVAVQPR